MVRPRQKINITKNCSYKYNAQSDPSTCILIILYRYSKLHNEYSINMCFMCIIISLTHKGRQYALLAKHDVADRPGGQFWFCKSNKMANTASKLGWNGVGRQQQMFTRLTVDVRWRGGGRGRSLRDNTPTDPTTDPTTGPTTAFVGIHHLFQLMVAWNPGSFVILAVGTDHDIGGGAMAHFIEIDFTVHITVFPVVAFPGFFVVRRGRTSTGGETSGGRLVQ